MVSAHPSTFAAEPQGDDGIGWNDCASLQIRDGGGGLFHAMKRVRTGSFAELVAFVVQLPVDEGDTYAVAKAGDRLFLPDEIRLLALRPDFPLHVGNGG